VPLNFIKERRGDTYSDLSHVDYYHKASSKYILRFHRPVRKECR